MEQVLKYIDDKYGSIQQYLIQIGFDLRWQAKLRHVLLVDKDPACERNRSRAPRIPSRSQSLPTRLVACSALASTATPTAVAELIETCDSKADNMSTSPLKCNAKVEPDNNSADTLIHYEEVDEDGDKIIDTQLILSCNNIIVEASLQEHMEDPFPVYDDDKTK